MSQAIETTLRFKTLKPLSVNVFMLFSWVEDLRGSKTSLAPSNLGMMLERSFGSQSTLSAEYRPVMEELEETLSNIMAPKINKRMHIPVVRILDIQVINSDAVNIWNISKLTTFFMWGPSWQWQFFYCSSSSGRDVWLFFRLQFETRWNNLHGAPKDQRKFGNQCCCEFLLWVAFMWVLKYWNIESDTIILISRGGSTLMYIMEESTSKAW